MNEETDLCEMLNVTCPVKKGEKVKVEKTVEMPEQIPKGLYGLLAEATSPFGEVDGDVLGCVGMELQF